MQLAQVHEAARSLADLEPRQHAPHGCVAARCLLRQVRHLGLTLRQRTADRSLSLAAPPVLHLCRRCLLPVTG